MAAISTILNDCLKELADVASSRVQRYENEVSQTRWLDELGRLRIWAANTSALRCDQLSLDYRLRHASHLKNEISRILLRVLRVIESLSDLLDEPEDTTGDEAFMDAAGETLDEEDLMTDVQMLHQSLHNAISLLNQLSLETRKPADHDLLLDVSVKNVSLFETWAQQHVSRNFPNIDEATLHRLVTAMMKRRAVLQYRPQKPRPSDEIDGFESTVPEREAAGSSQAGGLDQLQRIQTSTSELQTPYPTAAFIDPESVTMPRPPENFAYDCPFECPYCGSLMIIKGLRDWFCHVLEDLMPYTCLSSDCTTPSKLYESRSRWYRHMCEVHPVPNNDDLFLCPLCKNSFEPPITFEQHVGEHLEQLALFILRAVSEHNSPDATFHTTSLKVSKDTTLPVSELKLQNPSKDRPAIETTNAESTAERPLEAAQQNEGPFDNSFKAPIAHSDAMNHSQVFELPIDSDKDLNLLPTGQEMSTELQDEADPLSPVGSLSPIELDSPVDLDQKSDCIPVPSSRQSFDRQAALDRFFPDVVQDLPQLSTQSHAVPSKLLETNRASPGHGKGQSSTQYLSDGQPPISDDLEIEWKLRKSEKDPARSDEEAQLHIPSAFLRSDRLADLPGRKPPPPAKNKPTKLLASILPTYHDFTSNDLNEEADEYIQTKFDDVGETKIDFLGYLRHNREYKCQTFRLPYRGKKLFMLSSECAEALSFRNSRILFMNYRSLHKMVASSVEKETLIEKHILPFEEQHMDVTFVSARSIFLQFGCRIIVSGRRFQDDYWESRAREEGFTEADTREEPLTASHGWI